MLGFADDNKLKIGYAISFGNERRRIDPYLRNLYSDLLKRFDALSVREDYSVDMCKRLFETDAAHVADPVFLPDKEQWVEIASKSEIEFTEDYLLAYILDPTEKKKELIEKAAAEYGLKTVIIVDANRYDEKKKQMKSADVIDKPAFEDWLAYFYHASRIITDSFHGTCFSVIFEKEFVTLKARQTHRFNSLSKRLDSDDQENSFFYDNTDAALESEELFKKRDYVQIRKNIGKLRNESTAWLEEQLKKTPENKLETNKMIINHAELYRAYLDLTDTLSDYAYEERIARRKTELSEKYNDYYEIISGVYKLKKVIRPSFVKEPTADLYFDQLLRAGDAYTTVLSCKADCSKHLENFIQKTRLNIQTREMPFRHSFAAVLHGNYNILEKVYSGIISEDVVVSERTNPIYIRVISSANKHNIRKSIIMVNNIDWSINMRGLNIVVIDNRLGMVIDTFNVDTFESDSLVINRKK